MVLSCRLGRRCCVLLSAVTLLTLAAAPVPERTSFSPRPTVLPATATPILSLAYSPDGQFLATAHEDQTVMVRALPEFQVRHTLAGHGDAVTCLVFAPDSQ